VSLFLHPKHADAANKEERKKIKCYIAAFNEIDAAECNKHKAVE
jgi:hypothetical protein